MNTRHSQCLGEFGLPVEWSAMLKCCKQVKETKQEVEA